MYVKSILSLCYKEQVVELYPDNIVCMCKDVPNEYLMRDVKHILPVHKLVLDGDYPHLRLVLK